MKRNKFNLSYDMLTTGVMGKLYPIGLTEVLPGDSFEHSTSLLVRLSPMAAPVMHQMDVRVHHFFVPHRLVWDDNDGTDWEEFITGGPDGLNADTVPTISTTGTAKDLLDYYGLPGVAGIDVSALPIRGFNHIFNEYFRDADLVTERAVTDLSVPRIAWEKDYFTTARPWAQKGTEVTLPLGTSAPINAPVDGSALSIYSDTSSTYLGANTSSTYLQAAGAGSAGAAIYADLSGATAANVNDIRRAFALQRFAEARARYGSRYTEYLRYLGVRVDESVLDRPEYLGGGQTQVNISEIVQTAPETVGAPEFGVGDLYGHGVAAMRSNKYRRYFEEFGYVHTVLSVRPRAVYTNGIDRTWLRKDKEDFFQRELQFIGQQPIWKNEIYAAAGQPQETWGFQDRYNEYKSQTSKVAGDFRSTLDYWHLGRQFGSAPTLNSSFIECNPDTRIFNEQTTDHLWVAARHRLAARRIVDRSSTARII